MLTLPPCRAAPCCADAHAATEQLESYVAKSSSKLPVLSQQQGADCTKNPRDCGGTGGCEGGTTRLVLEGFADNGAANVWTYPYRSFWGTDYACVFNNTNAGPTGTPVVATMKGVFAVPGNNYSSTMTALAVMGPLGVAVDAAAWPDYHSGVYNGCLANTTILDHAGTWRRTLSDAGESRRAARLLLQWHIAWLTCHSTLLAYSSLQSSSWAMASMSRPVCRTGVCATAGVPTTASWGTQRAAKVSAHFVFTA